jgi:hypothetical protein
MVVRAGERLIRLLSSNKLDPGGIPFEQDRMQILQQMESEMDEMYTGLFHKFNGQCHSLSTLPYRKHELTSNDQL